MADRQADARAAFEAGRAATDASERLRWLDRAHRLLPADPTLRLALAEACLGRDDARAESLLLSLASRHDTREIWLALAASRLARRDGGGAAEALSRALSCHAMPPSLAPFADAVVVAAGAPGWCGLGADGGLVVGPAGIVATVRTTPDRLNVTVDGRPLLCSPLTPQALARVEGFVEATLDGGLRGWAWHPANPDADPVLNVVPAGGASLTVHADTTDPSSDGGLLARRRRFSVPATALARLSGPFHVVGADSRELLGSPVGVGAVSPADAVPDVERRQAGIDVIVAVHGGLDATLTCLESVLASVAPSSRVIVVDDATPEPGLAAALDALVDRGVVLIRHPTTCGFPEAANAGLRMAAASGRDAVLLNSDTLVPPGWLEALHEAAHGASDIGTVTPLSNSAGIVSYPGPDGSNPTPDLAGTGRFAALARRANAAMVVDIPVGVGFCLYIRGDCLRATGLFRT
ncbi:MAG: glycosyltransferase, partial [Acetobacteraceae bacterium]